MPIQVDWMDELIEITSPTTEVDLQSLHDVVEDERGMASPIGLIRSAILTPEGKIEDPVNPGVFSQIILVLQSPWQIQFWGGSGYTRVYGGKIVGGLNDQPIKATGTAGDVTVLESPVDGILTIASSGVGTPGEVADAVWDAVRSGHDDAGSFGEAVDELAAFAGGGWEIDTDTDQLILYKADNVTEVARFDLLDDEGQATSTRVFERQRV